MQAASKYQVSDGFTQSLLPISKVLVDNSEEVLDALGNYPLVKPKQNHFQSFIINLI